MKNGGGKGVPTPLNILHLFSCYLRLQESSCAFFFFLYLYNSQEEKDKNHMQY